MGARGLVVARRDRVLLAPRECGSVPDARGRRERCSCVGRPCAPHASRCPPCRRRVLVASYLLGDSLGAGGLRWEPVTKAVARFAGFAFSGGFATPAVVSGSRSRCSRGSSSSSALGAVRVYLGRRAGPVRVGFEGASPAARLAPSAGGLSRGALCGSPDGVGDGYNLKGTLSADLVGVGVTEPPVSLPPAEFGSPSLSSVSALLLWQVTAFGMRATSIQRGLRFRRRSLLRGGLIVVRRSIARPTMSTRHSRGCSSRRWPTRRRTSPITADACWLRATTRRRRSTGSGHRREQVELPRGTIFRFVRCPVGR